MKLDLEVLNSFMLSNENITKIMDSDTFFNRDSNNNREKNCENKATIKKIEQNSTSLNEFFIPKENDSLFWCYFIIKNGLSQYEMINNKNLVFEKQTKISYIDLIRKNKLTVKANKFDTITNLENNLANENNISIKTILTLCAIENINVVYIYKNVYFELLNNDIDVIYVIREKDIKSKYNKKCGFETIDSKILNDIRNTYYKVDNIDKPIKSMSAYKVGELADIASKLAIDIINKDTGKQMTKQNIYESIVQYFSI